MTRLKISADKWLIGQNGKKVCAVTDGAKFYIGK